MVSISGIGSWCVSLLVLACCWYVPMASTQTDVDFQCPCLVRSACPQYYGSSPLDVARFGVVPPCPVYGRVRCCLKSASFHLPAVSADESTQDAVVVSGVPVSQRARKRFVLRRRRPDQGRFRLNKPASDLRNRAASSDVEDTVVINSSVQPDNIFVQEHSNFAVDETDDQSSSVFAKSLFDSLDSSDGTIFTDGNGDQFPEPVPVETVVVTQVSVESGNKSAPAGQDVSESSFAESSGISSSDFIFADELIEEISSSDRQHAISESPKSFIIEQITFNSEPEVAGVVDREQFIVHANAAEGNSFEGDFKNFSLEFGEDSADKDVLEIQFPGENVSETSSEVMSAELTGDKDPLGLNLYRIGRHPSVIEFRRISAFRPRNVSESLEPRPPCGCYTCGTCPVRYETVSAASEIPCLIGFESCCFPDDPWPGFVLSETAIQAPCSRRERCKRPYGLTALDVQVFGVLEPCYLGQVRCMDQLLLEADAFTADQLVLPAAECRLQGNLAEPDVESDLFVESVLSQAGQQKPTTIEEFVEPQVIEDNMQTDEGAEPHLPSETSSPETELVFGELFVEGDDGFQSASVGIPPFLEGTPDEDVTNTHQVPMELPFVVQTMEESSDPETLLGGLPSVSEDVVGISIGEHSNGETVGTSFDPEEGLIEIPAPDMTQSEEFSLSSFDVHSDAPAPTYVYPEPNDGLLFPADLPLVPIPSLYSPPVPKVDHLPLSHRDFDSRVSEDQTPASSELDLVASPSTHDIFTSRYSSSPMYVVASPDLSNQVQTNVHSNGHSSFPHAEETDNRHVYNSYLPPETAPSESSGSGSSFVTVLQPSVSLNVRGHTPGFLPEQAAETSDLTDTRPLSEVHLLVPSGAGVEQNQGATVGSSTGVDSSNVPGDETDSAVTDLGNNQEYSYSNTTTVLISHDVANTADVSEALFAVVKAASLASQVSSNNDVDTPDAPDEPMKLLTTNDVDVLHTPPPIIVESNVGFSPFLVRCVSVSECGRWFGSHPSDLQVLGYLEGCPEGFVRCLDGYKNELLQSTLDTTASDGLLQQQHRHPIKTADTNITGPVNLSTPDLYRHSNDHNSGAEFNEIPPPAETTTRINHMDSSYWSSVETSTHVNHVDSSYQPPVETSTHVNHVDSSYGHPAEMSTHVNHVDSSYGTPAETSTHVNHVDLSSGTPAETSTHANHVDSSYGPPAKTPTHVNHDGYSSYGKPSSYPSQKGRYPVKSISSQPTPSHAVQHRPRIPVFQGVSPNKLSFQAQKTVQVGPLGASHFGKTVSVSTPVKTISGSVSLRNPFLLDLHKKTPVAHHPYKSQHVISKLTPFIKPLAVGIAHKGHLAAHHLNKIPNTFVEKVKGLSQIHNTFSRPIYKNNRSPVLSHTPRYPPRPGRYPPAVGRHRQPTQKPRYRPNLPKTTRRPSTAYGAPKQRPASSYHAPTVSHRHPPRRPVQPLRPYPVYKPAVRGAGPGRSPRLLPSGYEPPQHRPTPVYRRPSGYQPSAMNRPPGTKTTHGRPVDYTRRRPATRVPGLGRPIGSFRSPRPVVRHHRSQHRYRPASVATQEQTVRQHYRPPY